MMEASSFTAFAGLAGAAIGALTSVGTTWVSQRAQLREQHSAAERKRRESLYVEFMKEGSRLYADALSHERDDVADLVILYSIAAHVRMLSGEPVIAAADAVIRAIVDAYHGPNRSLTEMRNFAAGGGMDPLREFSLAARAEFQSDLISPNAL
jgi:hypothetical protein